MAVCHYCGKKMAPGVSCLPDGHVLGGVDYPAIRWGDEDSRLGEGGWGSKGCLCDASHPCGGCGTAPGEVHHPGCDLEECPACRGQLLTCGCYDQYDQWNCEHNRGSGADSVPPPRRCRGHRRGLPHGY
jgi:hypothetical protein